MTALAPVLLLPATLGASSSFLATPSKPDDQEPRELGVGGHLPQAPRLSPEVLEQAADPQQLATGAGPQVELPTGPLGIPAPVLAAYVRAADQVDRANSGCGLHWSVLASIGRIESGHARSGSVDVLGTTVRAILGPRLSGGADVAAIPDTDAGRYDGDPVWDRAVGPMQFIPSTWLKFAVDGNGDGVASPHNIHDASLAAGHYLCGGGGGLRSPRDLAAAVFRYNHSDSYVRTVLIWAAAYASGVTPTPSELAPEVGDVLDGERLPDGPAVLAMAPPPAPAQVPPSAAPAPTGPPPPAPPARPAEPSPTLGVELPSIPEPSPPNLTPPETPTLPNPSSPGTPPSSTQPGTPPDLTPPSAPPGSTQPGTPPDSTHPGTPPGTPPPSTQPVTPPPSATQPGTPPPSAPGGPTPPPGGSTPTPEPPAPPTSTPSEPPKSCDPVVLASGEFATSEQSPGTILEPGESDPHAALPGQTVYVEAETAGLLAPCVVPDGFTAPR